MKKNLFRLAGFTLIELLVVIAIIALIAAIIFPVFAAAREKARQTTCMSNMQQLGLATMQYVQDNDEAYPSYYENGSGDYNGYWRFEIYPFVHNPNIFVCPDTPNTTANPQTNLGLVLPDWHNNYAVNFYVFVNLTHSVPPVFMNNIGSPGSLVLYEDSSQGYDDASSGQHYDAINCGITANWPSYIVPADARHKAGGGDVVCFADGHAKFCTQMLMGNIDGTSAVYAPASLIATNGTSCGGSLSYYCWGLAYELNDTRVQ